ncbi:MAG TPA: class B sortase [Clostridiaceae bacterium]|jgi:sortase B|nr:class B sortase [Clostridiaceae bacterium]
MKKKNKILITLIQIVLIVVIIFSGIKIIEWIKSNKKNKDIMSEIKENVVINNEMDSNNEEYKIDFAKLKQKNSDAIAWIKVNGTDIDFPVVKGTDNSYYLTHNFDKEKNKAGWIFADYRNKFDGTDKNIIIYGHNMKNGSMFASLKDVIKEEWYNNENNKYIALITENENCKYQVFSVYQIETEEYYLQTNISNFKEFVEKIKGRSKKDFNVDIKETDSILTLSTCADNTKYRVVLHAVKVK